MHTYTCYPRQCYSCLHTHTCTNAINQSNIYIYTYIYIYTRTRTYTYNTDTRTCKYTQIHAHVYPPQLLLLNHPTQSCACFHTHRYVRTQYASAQHIGVNLYTRNVYLQLFLLLAYPTQSCARFHRQKRTYAICKCATYRYVHIHTRCLCTYTYTHTLSLSSYSLT